MKQLHLIIKKSPYFPWVCFYMIKTCDKFWISCAVIHPWRETNVAMRPYSLFVTSGPLPWCCNRCGCRSWRGLPMRPCPPLAIQFSACLTHKLLANLNCSIPHTTIAGSPLKLLPISKLTPFAEILEFWSLFMVAFYTYIKADPICWNLRVFVTVHGSFLSN
jgi:hypothetical protein